MKKILLAFFTALTVSGVAVRAAEPEVLMNADFTVLTEGTESLPVAIDKSALNKLVPTVYAYGTNNKKTYQAGGSLFLADGGMVEFASMSKLPSSPKGTIRVTAEVKMGGAGGGILTFSSNSYSAKSQSIIVSNGEWNTITFYYSDLGRYDRPNVSPFLSLDGMFVKSVKIEYSPDFIIAPVAYLPNDADGTSFTASCSRVSGASKYEMDVFSLDGGNNKVYFLQNEPLTALSSYSDPKKKVEGLDAATTYYYVVRAIGSAGNKSDDSEPVQVVKCISSIAAPVAVSATNITDAGYTATWNAVEDAVAYDVTTYVRETTTEAGEVNVFGEDFSGVTIGTPSSVDFSTDPLDSFTKTQGWITDFSKAFASGYYVMNCFLEKGVLLTPAMDLSKNDGKFEVKIAARVGSFGSYYESANTLQVELVEADDVDVQSTTSIESAPAQTFSTADENVYRFEFTKGTANCRLRIIYDQSIDTSYKLFINDINISQEVPAGYVIERIVGSARAEGDTSADIKLVQEKGKKYFFDVCAVGVTVVGSGSSAEIGEIKSQLSNRVEIAAPAGVDDVAGDNIAPKAWKAADGVLGVNGNEVSVYDLNGRVLYTENNLGGSCNINLGVQGLVIVVVDGGAYKVVL